MLLSDLSRSLKHIFAMPRVQNSLSRGKLDLSLTKILNLIKTPRLNISLKTINKREVAPHLNTHKLSVHR